ncbi:MAG: hemerythrin domain-containing protein [Streptomyces sp.]|uniref:hemerythrin domain-containing protein n=1 Tax=Streptomyces sp. TaxID=1931 RepID=UPI003D6BFC7E
MSRPIAALPKGHQTMLLVHRAMVRDLDRLQRTAEQLAHTPDESRTAALRTYAGRLLEVIEHHHEGEDEYLWPRLRERGADEEALSMMTAEHEELAESLHATMRACERLASGGETAAELAVRTAKLNALLKQHAEDEENELLGRLAPALDERAWKELERGMLKTAPSWTLGFMPPWLASVAGPEEKGGVPVPPVARLFRGRLRRQQRRAFGEHA